jgi:hypothetical protein
MAHTCVLRRIGIGFWVVLGIASLAPAPARALHPESPEVKRAINKAVAFLETADDNRLGGKCLIGMVFNKLGHKDDHPKIAAAVDACKKVCQADAAAIKNDIYSTGIAIIFLCETDPSKYRPEIVKLMESLELRQREDGSWGYPPGHAHADTGDTSMIQYAVLATWSSYRNGIEVSQDSVERVANWLLRTQDPTGGFGYQGKDPGIGNYNRVAQGNMRNSMGAAGSGSLYICADLLRFKPIELPEENDEETSLPPALVLVDDAKGKVAKGPITERVPARNMQRGLTDANGWMNRNFTVDQGNWNNYYLYALERYQSFRELAEGINDAEPRWYNEGARHLIKKQAENGSWNEGAGEPVDTAFGALFLMRSTKKAIQKSIKKFGDGQLTGGRALARSRDFDSVPVLIYALSDPDVRVVREAEAGLRFVARRIGPSMLPERPTEDHKKQAVEEWTRWYAAVRPDATNER